MPNLIPSDPERSRALAERVPAPPAALHPNSYNSQPPHAHPPAPTPLEEERIEGAYMHYTFSFGVANNIIALEGWE